MGDFHRFVVTKTPNGFIVTNKASRDSFKATTREEAWATIKTKYHATKHHRRRGNWIVHCETLVASKDD